MATQHVWWRVRYTRMGIIGFWLLLLAWVAFGLFLLVTTPRAHATDSGQYANTPDHIRAWFKSVRSKSGIPCCDTSDGHLTDYETRGDDYFVPINGTWLPVPKEAVVTNYGNPMGQAVVWYSDMGGTVFIRCFVPGGGV